ncbi:mediator-associated protein 1-like [Dorcoceras hygrometricum]|uniref:Mediator-associated protein 1-like n=1 Tax=Dorcoceras hygrometricum TaxID=472368 RepID=A0A2Z7A5Z1_9LAMI|nr:mediator-associated protein 1-like [Dorcoceras hygrometricum]
MGTQPTQDGYLKLLQMGTQTQQDKAGNKYEVKPQYEELSKQINMQYAINQCYECMRAIKESLDGRHSHPVVTAPTIALNFSDTTQQSASRNVAPNQILNEDTSNNNSSLLPLKLPRHARRNLLLNSAVSRFRSSSTQPPRLVGKKGLLERFPTLPRTRKRRSEINGKSR